MQYIIPTRAEFTFFSSAYRTLTKINYMLGHKTSLNIFNMVVIIQRTLFAGIKHAKGCQITSELSKFTQCSVHMRKPIEFLHSSKKELKMK